jgi:hypothetical protein
MMTARRFPPPWSIEETGACFIVRDGAGQAAAAAERGQEKARLTFASRASIGHAPRTKGQHAQPDTFDLTWL